MIPPQLYEQLIDELAERVANRVEDRLASRARMSGASAEVDAWKVLTLAEAAAVLGRSTKTVRGWVNAGQLEYVRLDGGAWGFLLEDLQAFAKARRVSADGL